MREGINLFLKSNKPRFYFLLALFLVCLGIFGVLAHQVVGQNKDWFDTRVFTFLAQYSTPGVVRFFNGLTFFGTMTFLLPAYLTMVIFLLWKKRRQEATDIIFIGLTSIGLMYGLKVYYSRQRPDMALIEQLTTFSFPSGHALCSFIFCSVLIYHVWQTVWNKKWKWILSFLLLLTAIFIGISRIVLRYHYASDVLAGLCMGMAWVLFSLWLQSKLRIKPPKV